MKLNPPLNLCAALALSCLLAGCTGVTPGSQTQLRIQERRTVYNTLTPQQQNDILGGAIERGNTTDMVYLALGKPTKIVTSADGQKAMWVYVEYYTVNGPTSTGFNSRSTTYKPELVAPNTPYAGNIKATAPMVFAATGSIMVQELDVPDMASKTVYVFFFEGRVAEIKSTEDSPDQHSTAPHGTAKSGT